MPHLTTTSLNFTRSFVGIFFLLYYNRSQRSDASFFSRQQTPVLTGVHAAGPAQFIEHSVFFKESSTAVGLTKGPAQFAGFIRNTKNIIAVGIEL